MSNLSILSRINSIASGFVFAHKHCQLILSEFCFNIEIAFGFMDSAPQHPQKLLSVASILSIFWINNGIAFGFSHNRHQQYTSSLSICFSIIDNAFGFSHKRHQHSSSNLSILFSISVKEVGCSHNICQYLLSLFCFHI